MMSLRSSDKMGSCESGTMARGKQTEMMRATRRPTVVNQRDQGTFDSVEIQRANKIDVQKIVEKERPRERSNVHFDNLHISPAILVYCGGRCSFIWTKPKSGETGSRLVSKSSCERPMLQRTKSMEQMLFERKGRC
jgi:hypothetical protein